MTERKLKGLTTELQSQLYFTQLGYNVSVPLGEDCKYDFIVDVESKLLRVQAKSCVEDKTGISFSCKSTYLLSSRSYENFYMKEDIDFFCTSYKNICYLVPIELCGTGAKKLLFEKSNTPLNNTLWIQDYEASKILELVKTNHIFIKKEYKIRQYSLEGELIQTFNSCGEATRFFNKPKNNAQISRCVKGERKTAFGYIWKIVE